MNHQLNARRTRRFRPLRRQGISLFEVLISILVAAIGVFGVLILIPFAVRSAEVGIATETAINAAKNYHADFEAQGFHNPGNWVDDLRTPEVAAPIAPSVAVDETLPPIVDGLGNLPANNIVIGRPFIIDPLTAVQNFNSLGEFGQFPNPSSPGFPLPADFPTLNITSLLDQVKVANGAAQPWLDLELARRLTSDQDDLVFKAPAEELQPPRQAYFSTGTVRNAKRQYTGKYSTISFVVPNDDQGNQYRLITIVGAPGDRSSERVFEVIQPGAASGPPAGMRPFMTDTGVVGSRQFEQIALGGGDLRLSEIPSPGQPTLEKDQIRNNDWFILLSYQRLLADPALEPMFDDIQIGFFRTISADRETPDAEAMPPRVEEGCVRGGPAERTYTVTLQGADFNVARDWNAADAMLGVPTAVPTYAILLPNVLAVYERTISAEQLSTWNIAN